MVHETAISINAKKKYTSDLRPQDWAQIERLIVVKRRSKWPLLEVVNGILYVLKNGCGWRDLPGEFPCWNTVHYYFTKGGKDGTWENINACLLLDYREKAPTVEKKMLLQPRSSSTRKASKTPRQPRQPSASMGAN